MALLIDWGGVLTTSMLGSFEAFGAARASTSARRSARTPRRATRWSSSRPAVSTSPTFERRLGSRAVRRPDGPREPLTQDVRPDHEMLDAVRGFHDRLPTALVSNSWRDDDYDVDDSST